MGPFLHGQCKSGKCQLGASPAVFGLDLEAFLHHCVASHVSRGLLHFLPQHLVQLTVKFQVSLPPLLLGQPNLKSNFRSGPAPPDPYVLTPNEVVVVLDSVAFVYLANRNRQEQIPSIQVFLEFLAVCHLRLWLATACLYCGRSSLVSYLLGS